MMMEERKELVGKRFLCVSGGGKLKFSRISEWDWKSGVIRAVSHKPEDQKHPDFSTRPARPECEATPPSRLQCGERRAALSPIQADIPGGSLTHSSAHLQLYPH
ncbi:JMJD1C [Branchiostoma lanceolatum]|uniref:JMJD1C protein n=1 Tax=Branchiostoma lanceolatum TaxID=7740 RepID=A0A8J9ZSD3_BRALA|nr:JMJD1C [Branchiostoma lanceolatum]